MPTDLLSRSPFQAQPPESKSPIDVFGRCQDRPAGAKSYHLHLVLQVRNHVVQGRREVHLKMRSMSLEQLPYVTNPDDSVRTFSFIFALIKFLNKATQVSAKQDRLRKLSCKVWMRELGFITGILCA